MRDYLDGFENLFLVGRNGMHRYNNQDHSMLTAMTAVDNIVAGSRDKAPSGRSTSRTSTTRKSGNAANGRVCDTLPALVAARKIGFTLNPAIDSGVSVP